MKLLFLLVLAVTVTAIPIQQQPALEALSPRHRSPTPCMRTVEEPVVKPVRTVSIADDRGWFGRHRVSPLERDDREDMEDTREWEDQRDRDPPDQRNGGGGAVTNERQNSHGGHDGHGETGEDEANALGNSASPIEQEDDGHGYSREAEERESRDY